MRQAVVCLAMFLGLAGAGEAGAPQKINLAVLYVGTPSTPRAQAYLHFLTQHFRQAAVAQRMGFRAEQARPYDVVLLDWSQDERPTKPTSPLGSRESWGKPTVLLGSAGLLLAEAWDIHGAIG